MLEELRRRYSCRFYRLFPWQNAIEAEHLFFVVCDVMFLHTVKGVSFAQFSFLISFSLLFSIVIQYPLLKCIHAMGTCRSVRLGSLFFLLSALCFTFAPNYWVIMAGGIAKCIGFTFNLLGPALLKEKLVQDGRDNEYVAFQSDANNMACLLMMLSSLSCGFLFSHNPYFPMFGCIIFCALGVLLSFVITSCCGTVEEKQTDEKPQIIKRNKVFLGIPLLVSFGLLTAMTGIGLSYARINFQEALTLKIDLTQTLKLLGVVSFLVYLFRFLSNVLMSKFFSRLGRRLYLALQLVLAVSLAFQILPWVCRPTAPTLFLLPLGYLGMSFVRDPYVTAVQNESLLVEDPIKRQSNMVTLNFVKKVGALFLSTVFTLMLKETSISSVMVVMCTLAAVSLFLAASQFVIGRRNH